MIRELDSVVLTHDIDEHGLKRGDLGAVVHVYGDNIAYEVEFVTADGYTAALLTLKPADVRLMTGQEILNARPMAKPERVRSQ
ncbi:MAG: DUF4926 domain-containing protein [Dehalococcoidia bacterium]